MINIEKFIQIRKNRNFSQTKLAKGICTQTTLSNLESGKKIPSFKILLKLCKRLNIEIGDIVLNSTQTTAAKRLTQAEYAYLNLDYSQIFDLLTSLSNQELHLLDQIHYNYLQGIYTLENKRDQITALSYFSAILEDERLKQDNIYYMLALTGSGESYNARSENDHAYEYFNSIYDLVFKFKPNNDNVTAMQFLLVLRRAGEFFGKNREYKKSSALLRFAYQFASKKHYPYYLGRILYRLGLNEIANGTTKQAKRHLQDARSFARFNHDQYILTKSRQALSTLEALKKPNN